MAALEFVGRFVALVVFCLLIYLVYRFLLRRKRKRDKILEGDYDDTFRSIRSEIRGK